MTAPTNARDALHAILGIVLAAALLALAACANRAHQANGANRATAAHPTGALAGGASRPVSCIWIVVDTLRADHLERYGYGRATAPELQPLVSAGVTFDNAYTSLPETTPAIASMLTSLHPYRHGVQRLYYRLNERNVTAAQLLAGAGWATGGFVSSFVMIDQFSNLGKGFQIYDDFVTERERYRDNYERKAAGTLALAQRWIAAHRAAPFFCFIHLIDPHGPYTPPGEFAHRFHSGPPVRVNGPIPDYQKIPGVDDLNVYRDLYDGEIAYAAHELGGFLTALRRGGLFDPTLIVFTADHGEEIGEHGTYFTHGTDLFQQNVHVPLIIKPPADFAALAATRGGRVAQPVSVIDLLPTILEILGRPRPASFQGRSLVPLLAGAPGAGDNHGAVFFELDGPHPLAGEVRGGRKTLLRVDDPARVDDPGRIAQYDLAADPGEQRPLAPDRQDPAVLAELRAWQRAAAAWKRDFTTEVNVMAYGLRGAFIDRRRGHPGNRPPDPADLQRLRSLGYL